MTISANELLMGASTAAKFTAAGDTVEGTIVSDARTVQQRDPQSGEPLYWRDGTPKYQIVVTLATAERADEEDDGHRTLYVKGAMLGAIRSAVRNAKAKGLAVNGRLKVTMTGFGEPPAEGLNAPKEFTATYIPPTR